MRKVFEGNMTENIKISSDEFYKLGGFSNPSLFRNSQGHFKEVLTKAYKEYRENQPKASHRFIDRRELNV